VIPAPDPVPSDAAFEDLIRQVIVMIGDNPTRLGMQDTPKRFVKACKHWFGGYKKNVADEFKQFSDGAEQYDGMVFEANIPLWSHCEHHGAVFFGIANIGYIPAGQIIGLSKMKRVIEVFARRFQVQERLTSQIADAFVTHLQCAGVGVNLLCRHTCMESRGVQTHGTLTDTTALRGVLRTDPSAQAEFTSKCASLRRLTL